MRTEYAPTTDYAFHTMETSLRMKIVCARYSIDKSRAEFPHFHVEIWHELMLYTLTKMRMFRWTFKKHLQ